MVGVQEGVWPDLRRRGSLLQHDRLGPDGALLDPVAGSTLLNEERRLFYVACTRAMDTLVVTAVEGGAEGDQPSRFVDLLGVPARHVFTRPPRPLSASALVASLRAALESPESSDALKAAAASRLKALGAFVPAARPENWWGLAALSQSSQAVRPADEPVRLSGSSITALTACPRKWFLEKEAKAASVASDAQAFGKVVHVIAENVAREVLPPNMAVLEAEIDAIWSRMNYGATWLSAQQRGEAVKAISRFLTWHDKQKREGRIVVGLEQSFKADIDVAGDDGVVHKICINGFADRIEIVPVEGGPAQAWVYDYKTERNVSGSTLVDHPQLALYQLAIRERAFDGIDELADAEPAGAALVQLRSEGKREPGLPKMQSQPALESPVLAEEDNDGVITHLRVVDLIEGQLFQAAQTIRTEEFAAVPSRWNCQYCSFRSSCPAFVLESEIEE